MIDIHPIINFVTEPNTLFLDMYNLIRLSAVFLFFMIVFSNCKIPKLLEGKENFIETLMSQNSDIFSDILKNRDSLRVQIIYTKIDRDKKNRPHLTDFYFNVKNDLYFYPASTVKMPVAFLALEKLNELNIKRNTTLITEKLYPGQTAVYNDPTTPDGRPTLEHYIKKIFLVSDNDANNRLYEFLGQQYLQDQLSKKGYPDAQIIRRLAITMPEDQHRTTNPISFRDSSGKVIYEQPQQSSTYNYLVRNQKIGKGFINDQNVLVNEPFDFSRKNRIYLTDLHQVLRSVLFPESVPQKQRFNLEPADYRFVYQYMSQLPSETKFPEYDTTEFYDAYCKFLLFGTQKHKPLPKQIRIFNKVGWSYGFLTDVAYIVDFEKNIEFMLSATIYCNTDGILNDDKYDYDSVGLPFLEKLGQQVYDYELKRTRKYSPDLSKFKVKYDK